MVVAPESPVTGLTDEQAAARLAADGPNLTPTPRPPSRWRHLAARFTDFFALLLWGAALLAALAGLPQLSIAIVVVVVLNALTAFIQEYRAERAASRLVDLLPRQVTVLRSGQVRVVDASSLVVGDLMLLDAGDRIPADARVLGAAALAVDVSSLTGESVPERPDEGDTVFAGCFVTEGAARAVVTATAGNTRLAGIAALTRSDRRPTSPLTLELRRLVRIVAAVAIGIGAAFVCLGMLLGMSAARSLVFGVGVTVALVPEALLPTVTLSLAIGAERLAGRHALVRRLESVETLGSVSFICTDKTGTLTTNEMTVVEAWTPAGVLRLEGAGFGPEATVTDGQITEQVRALALAGARCSTASIEQLDGRWVPHGDTMEAALVAFAQRIGVAVDVDAAARPETQRWPFDPRRRRMSMRYSDGSLVVKGAAESVLPCCDEVPAAAVEAAATMAAAGLRVLAVGARPAGSLRGAGADAGPVDQVERDLTLLGLVGLLDPPRPDAAAAVAACRTAGIRLAMITGDHPATAAAVAGRIGLIAAGGTGLVVEGRDLPEDDAVLGALLDRDGVVVARVDPEDKLRIAVALQGRGHVVAMTGDGVNDGPALARADIGIAMGRTGTDVAREAADLVLLDEDLSTVIAAVELGRATFANIRRFLTYHLTDNVAELTPFLVWALSGGRFPLVIGVLQVLALDIATDTMPAVALGAERPEPEVLSGPPERRHLFDRAIALRAFGVLGPTEAVLAMLAFLSAIWVQGWRPGDAFPTGAPFLAASGGAFLTIAVAQLTNAFACRSEVHPPWRLGWFTNRPLILAIAAESLVLAVLVGVPPVAGVLEQAAPAAGSLPVIVAAVPIMLAVDASMKRCLRRRHPRRGPDPSVRPSARPW